MMVKLTEGALHVDLGGNECEVGAKISHKQQIGRAKFETSRRFDSFDLIETVRTFKSNWTEMTESFSSPGASTRTSVCSGLSPFPRFSGSI